MKMLFNKTVLIALVAALGLASLPFVSVSAAGANAPISSDASEEVSNERLEKAWAHQLRVYERMGYRFDRSDFFVENLQGLIDRAKENGKDVTALQAALDAFKVALAHAKSVYKSGQAIVDAHEGFDANGKVTDPEKAKETVRVMGEKLKEIRTAMDGTGKALKEAIKAFREANPRPEKK
jgi:hypothetical protein